MVQMISNALGLVFREQWALQNFFDCLGDILKGGGARGIAATFVMMMQMFNMLATGEAVDAWGPELDLTGYELVFEDEFEGDELNMDIWKTRAEGASSRVGFHSIEQVSVNDGALKIAGEYREDGPYGEGWYTGAIALREWYTRGYFEIKMICAPSPAFWSAFWLQGDGSYNPETSKGGVGAVEIDICEAFYGRKGQDNAYTPAMHLSGLNGSTEDVIYSRNLGSFRGNNIYSEYNTYGMMWTEDEYIFYVNGVETVRTDFGDGICVNPEEVIVSLESPHAVNMTNVSKDDVVNMYVDYVRIYQLAE
ncbi:MAG: glycoside hydrolase family 16 protein [Clostridia bacterium]|nr:glycoside hydrolase family 16 protein [Clostridia bacterium]